MTNFFFKADDKSFFIYVWYPEETNCRYMINVVSQTCTCTGWSIKQDCKHLKELRRRLEVISDKLKDLIVLQ